MRTDEREGVGLAARLWARPSRRSSTSRGRYWQKRAFHPRRHAPGDDHRARGLAQQYAFTGDQQTARHPRAAAAAWRSRTTWDTYAGVFFLMTPAAVRAPNFRIRLYRTATVNFSSGQTLRLTRGGRATPPGSAR